MVRILRRLSALTLVATATLTILWASQASTPAPIDQVNVLLSRFMADANVVGVVAAVARGGETIVQRAAGLADRKAATPMTLDTSFRLGSVSKQFTASLVMRLVERQMVSPDDLVEKHYPELPKKWRGVTVRQLLNHTSGIPDFTDTSPSNWPKSLPPAEMLGLVADDSLHFAAGSKYEYSNSNYMLLGLIAERHYAKPLAQILADELFTPLGLKTMRFCEDAYGANGQARPYVRDNEAIEDAPYRSVAHSFGAGGICSTIADVVRWNQSLHGGKVVSAASYALMTTPSGAAAAAPERYGFGLGLRALAGREMVYHGGLVPGFITVNGWIAAEQLSITVLTNTSPTPQMNALFRDLTRIGLGQTITIWAPREGAQPDERTLRQYAGTYTIQVPGRPLGVRFWVENGQLVSQATGQNPATLRAVEGEHAFGSLNDWTVRFAFTMDQGKVTGFDFEQAGMKFKGTK
jgi:CubicO group peptidase (beta-lactamase class C family)